MAKELKINVPQTAAQKAVQTMTQTPANDKKPVGRPRKHNTNVPSAKEGLPADWTRASFLVRESYLDKLKDVAWTDRKTVKTVLDEALALYLKDKHPQKRKDNNV